MISGLFAALAAVAVVAAGSTASLAASKSKPPQKLVNYLVINEDSIPEYLSGRPGDPKQGRKLVISRKKGNCLACHKMPIPEKADHGGTGTDLTGVADRMTESQLRLRLVDPKRIIPDTMMPAFYKIQGLNRVLPKFKGKAILTAQEIEDIIAYIVTLKE